MDLNIGILNSQFLLLASGSEHSVSPTITAIFGLLLVCLIACLALEEKLHAKKSVIAGTFAIICLLLGAVFEILPFEDVVVGSHEVKSAAVILEPEANGDGEHAADAQQSAGSIAQSDVASGAVADETLGDGDSVEVIAEEEVHLGGHEVSMPVYIPAIDWGVIAIILGSSLFVDITSKSGLFTWIAIKVTKSTGGDPVLLLTAYGVMTVVFSAVLNNVTAMIIVGSLTAVSLDRLGRNKLLLGFLLVEGLLTNIGGLLTLISSVPNIIVGTAADISFVDFFKTAAPMVVVTTIVTIIMGARMFGIRRLSTAEEKWQAKELVSGFDENDSIESPGFFWFGVLMLILFITTIATTSVLPYISELQMGFVALAFAGIMLLRYKSTADQFYKALDWDLLGFFMALFVVINVMEHAGVLGAIGVGLEHVIALGDLWGTGAILVASAVFSSVTDNIPLAAMLSKILVNLGTPSDSPLWWSVVFGANLGGNITPIGSASTLVAVTIIHKHKLAMSFGGFVKVALPFALVQIVIATVYVLVFVR